MIFPLVKGVTMALAVPVVSDPIQPNHYVLRDGTTCIEVMRQIWGDEMTYNHMVMNAFEYLFRNTNKNGIEDVRKARESLNMALDIVDNI